MAHTKWIETNLWKAVTNGKMNQNDHDWDEGAICVQYKSASQNTASWTPFLLRSFTTESRGKSDRQCRCTILYRHMNRNDGRICGHAGDTRCTLRGCMNRNMEVISECRGVEVTGYCCTPCWCMNRNRQKLILPKNRGCILCGCINRNQAKEAAMFPLHTLHPTRMCESKSHEYSLLSVVYHMGAWIDNANAWIKRTNTIAHTIWIETNSWKAVINGEMNQKEMWEYIERNMTCTNRYTLWGCMNRNETVGYQLTHIRGCILCGCMNRNCWQITPAFVLCGCMNRNMLGSASRFASSSYILCGCMNRKLCWTGRRRSHSMWMYESKWWRQRSKITRYVTSYADVWIEMRASKTPFSCDLAQGE